MPAPARRAAALGAGIRPPFRPALVVVALVVSLSAAFAVLCSLALGRPMPHTIPAGLVGSTASHPRATGDFEHALAGALAFRPFASPSAARSAIERQQISTALVLTHRQPRLLIATAASASVARFRANAGSLTLTEWLGMVVLLAVSVGLVLTLATGPLIGALGGPFFPKWGLLSMEVACSALFNSAMLTIAHRWAVLPTWTLFRPPRQHLERRPVAPPLLPAFDASIGRWLPPGATVEALRSVVYFPATSPVHQVLVQAAWIAAGLAATVAAVRVLGRTPGGAPARADAPR